MTATLKTTFGAIGDGVADDTIAVNTALSCGHKVIAENGFYRCGKLNLYPGSTLEGETQHGSVLLAKDYLNDTFLSSANGMLTPGVSLSKLTIDGHWNGYDNDGNYARPVGNPLLPGPGNNVGNALHINGLSPKLYDLNIRNVPGTGLITEGSADSFRHAGTIPHVFNVTIIQTKHHGWVHNGPADLIAQGVYPINNSLGMNAGYYGVVLNSNGRFVDLHPYNLSNVAANLGTLRLAAAGVLVNSDGNSFSSCHFEGSIAPLHVVGSCNIFEGVTLYASRGSSLCVMGGSLNKMSGILLGGGVGAVRGIDLIGSFNTIDLIDSGCEGGTVNFAAGASCNIVRARGYHGGKGYAGTPHPTNEIDIWISAATVNNRLRQAVP